VGIILKAFCPEFENIKGESDIMCHIMRHGAEA